MSAPAERTERVRAIIKRFFPACLCLMLALTLLAGALAPAYAATGGDGAYKESEIRTKCDLIKKIIIETDQDNAYLTEYIVTCVKTVMHDVFSEFVNGFYPYVFGAGQVALILAVTIFGVMIATGAVEKSSRDSFVLLFKLSCVLFFMKPSTVEEIYGMGIDSMDAMTEIVYTYGRDWNSQRCYDNYTLWDRVDCMLDVIIGIVRQEDLAAAGKSMSSSGGSTTSQGVSRGLLYFFFTNMTASSVGFLIGALGFYVTYTFLFALVKSIHTYLAAIMGLSFLLIFMPMFVPMVMFKATRSYFDKWMRIAVSFILQPVILFAFLSLMMIAMDTMLISGENSFLKTAMGDDADKRNSNINETLDGKGVYTKGAAGNYLQHSDASAGISDPKRTQTGALGVRVEEGASEGQPNRLANDGNFSGLKTTYKTLDYEKLKDAVNCGSAEKCMEKLGLSIITIALTCFVFTSMLNYIPNMAADLSGGVYEVPNLFAEIGSKIPGMETAQGKMQNLTNGLTEKIRPQIEQFTNEVSRMVGGRR